jgi:outer membrane lipoprotein SlyB
MSTDGRPRPLMSYILFGDITMRIYRLMLSIAVLSQLTACVHHHRYVSSDSRYPDQYRTEYPAQYPAQNQYQSEYPEQRSDRAQRQSIQIDTAQVIGIRTITVESARPPSGGGTLVGAVIGGVIGHQLGKGNGRDLATVGGAIVGGAIGNDIERSSTHQGKHERKNEMTLRLNNGEVRSILIEQAANYRVGDTVRLTYQHGRLISVQ